MLEPNFDAVKAYIEDIDSELTPDIIKELSAKNYSWVHGINEDAEIC